MSADFDTLVQFFRDINWKFVQPDGQPVLVMGVKGVNGRWQCVARMEENPARLFLVSQVQVAAPENKRLPLALFLVRVNWKVAIGHFDLDFESGGIRYVANLNVEGDRLSPALIKNLLNASLWCMDRYLPGIMAIIEGGAEPLHALAQIDGKPG